MTLQLCFSCQNGFPVSALSPVTSFGDDLTSRFETLRSFVVKLVATTPQSRQTVAAIEDELRKLLKAIDGELKAKDALIDKQAAQIKYFSEREEQAKTSQIQVQAPRTARQATRSQPSISTQYASGLLQRFLSASRSEPVYKRGTLADAETAGRKRSEARADDESPSEFTATNAARPVHLSASRGAPLPMAAASVAVSKPSDLVAAALYSIVECTMSRVRAATTLLWLHPEHREEVVAPFVCGSEIMTSKYGVKPIQLSIATSTPGSVLTTGIAVNVLRPLAERGSTDMMSAVQGLTTPTLLVPVFRRYGVSNRDCIGVLQVVGHGTGSPFSSADENECALAASIVSHVVSQYKQFIADWCTRTYDPTVMTRVSQYSVDIDSEPWDASKFPGLNAMDDGVMAMRVPMLIYRSDAATARPISRTAVAGNGEQLTVRDLLKDVHRYTTTLESSWKRGVGQLAELQKKVDDLQRQLDMAKQGINEARRTTILRPSHPGGMVGPGSNLMSPKTSSRQLASSQFGGPPPTKPLVMGMSEVEDLEADVLHRAAVHAALPPVAATAPPVPRPKLSRKAAGASTTTFLTASE